MSDDSKGRKPPLPETERWRGLAEKASKEQDPKKLLETVEELCEELEQGGLLNRRRP